MGGRPVSHPGCETVAAPRVLPPRAQADLPITTQESRGNKLWKILREMGIPDHLTCLLRNLYAGQEATVRTGHGTTDWFQIGEGVCQGCILSPCLFNLYAEYIMRNSRLDESQAGIKIARRTISLSIQP